MRRLLLVSVLSSACVGSVASNELPDANADSQQGDNDAPSVDAPPPPPFPDETVTGWKPAGTFTTLAGTQTITVAGTVLQDVDIGGCVVINATNVTLRRARIRCQGEGVRVESGASATIEDVTIDGEGAGVTGVRFAGTGAMRRLDVHGFKRGVRLVNTDNVILEDSYVHAPVACKTPTDDASAFYQLAVEFSDTVTVRHNHFDRGNQDTCTSVDAGSGAHAARLTQAAANSVFEDNLVNGGTSYCLTIVNTCQNLAVRDNHFKSSPIATCAKKGPTHSSIPFSNALTENCTWTGNVWDSTGAPVAAP
jgi:hypothetical protein